VVSWMLSDNEGTVRDVARRVNNQGTWETQIIDHLVYGAFGNITNNPSFLPRFTYTGKQWDADAGVYYYLKRWYDAGPGRFLGEDPWRFAAGDANLTRYCGNSPANYTDPSGLEQITNYSYWHDVYEEIPRPQFRFNVYPRPGDREGWAKLEQDLREFQSQVIAYRQALQQMAKDRGDNPDQVCRKYCDLNSRLGRAILSWRVVYREVEKEHYRNLTVGARTGSNSGGGTYPVRGSEPCIQADHRTEAEWYRDRAQDTSLPWSERAAAIDASLEARWRAARIGALDRALTDMFRPRPGIGGTTSYFEQTLISGLGIAAAMRGGADGPTEAEVRALQEFTDPYRGIDRPDRYPTRGEYLPPPP